jgi:hypothetical protein
MARQLRDDSAPLLIGFVTAALAGVGVVVWLGHDASPLVLAAAIALELCLATAGAVTIGRLLRDEPADAAEPMRGRTRRPSRLALLPALLLPLVVAGGVLAAPRPQRTPVATVRGFLTAAVVDNDGESACAYLTARARVDFEGHGLSGHDTCQRFFGGATLRLGGHAISSDGQVSALHYAVEPVGHDRLVTCS